MPAPVRDEGDDDDSSDDDEYKEMYTGLRVVCEEVIGIINAQRSAPRYVRGIATKLKEAIGSDDHGSETEAQDPCAICFEELRVIASPFGCEHRFHNDCSFKWITENAENGRDACCPTCRSQM
jgi:hypothetical protein